MFEIEVFSLAYGLSAGSIITAIVILGAFMLEECSKELKKGQRR